MRAHGVLIEAKNLLPLDDGQLRIQCIQICNLDVLTVQSILVVIGRGQAHFKMVMLRLRSCGYTASTIEQGRFRIEIYVHTNVDKWNRHRPQIIR